MRSLTGLAYNQLNLNQAGQGYTGQQRQLRAVRPSTSTPHCFVHLDGSVTQPALQIFWRPPVQC